MSNQDPRLDQDMIARHKVVTAAERALRPLIALVALVGCRIPGGGVHEEAHPLPRLVCLAPSTASPTYRSFSSAMSEPPDCPRSNTDETSGLDRRSPRSASTRRRKYSASEIPSSAARFRARR